MMNIIDWINSKTKLVDKKYFKYKCTYVWATIFIHFFCIFFIAFLLTTFFGLHINTFAPEFTKEYLPYFVSLGSSEKSGIIQLLVADFFMFVLVYSASLSGEQIKKIDAKILSFIKNVEKTITFLYKPCVWAFKKMGIAADFILSKVCSKLSQ